MDENDVDDGIPVARARGRMQDVETEAVGRAAAEDPAFAEHRGRGTSATERRRREGLVREERDDTRRIYSEAVVCGVGSSQRRRCGRRGTGDGERSRWGVGGVEEVVLTGLGGTELRGAVRVRSLVGLFFRGGMVQMVQAATVCLGQWTAVAGMCFGWC